MNLACFKFFKKIILYILLVLICFYLIPFITLFSGTKKRDFCFREISYGILSDKLTTGCRDDSARIIQVYMFVIENISAPPQNFKLRDGNPFDIILDGVGSCDQQANVLLTLAGISGIKGNLLFLYGYDSVSHHSVCELQLNDKYKMLDPFYNQLFLTTNNNLASVNDIQNGNIKYPKDSSSMPSGYFRLFEKKHPIKIFMTNKISFPKKVVRKIINIWCSIFGDILLKPYMYTYFICDNSNEIKKNRIKKMLY